MCYPVRAISTSGCASATSAGTTSGTSGKASQPDSSGETSSRAAGPSTTFAAIAISTGTTSGTSRLQRPTATAASPRARRPPLRPGARSPPRMRGTTVADSTLAVFGGRPAVHLRFLPFLPLSEAEIAAADRSLRETPLTTLYGGHDVGRFEEGF